MAADQNTREVLTALKKLLLPAISDRRVKVYLLGSWARSFAILWRSQRFLTEWILLIWFMRIRLSLRKSIRRG